MDQGLRLAGLLRWSHHAGQENPRVHLITSSKAAGPAACFVMFKGTRADSHTFAADAHSAGCRVFLGDNEPALTTLRDQTSADAHVFCVTNARAAWAFLESLANGNPQARMAMAGITGTNGKTSTVWLMRGLVDQCDGPMVTIGTLGTYLKEQYLPTSHTSPDPDFLYQALANAADAGARSCGMEVSSHSLAQQKVWPIRFQFAAFTSFSRDHLDFHGTEDAYFNAKMALFRHHVAENARIALHGSVASRVMAAGPGAKTEAWIYGLGSGETGSSNSVTGSILGESPAGSDVEITIRASGNSPVVLRGTLPVFGSVFVENFMAALLGCHKLTGKWAEPAQWSQLRPVPGRMELVRPGKFDPFVFVDYAHTPDALAQVLGFAKKMAKSRGTRLWCVFGCGGDRDRGKRPMMASAAAGIADRIIVTSDNPRTENPDDIIQEILRGFPVEFAKSNVQSIADRAVAIERAVIEASPGDIILVAGKGHESWQEIHGEKLPFDDREVTAHALKVRKGITR